jgi:alpha-L-arabinofuranosidase
MLNAIKSLGVPIEFIELGNELYFNEADYVAAFPTGTDYAVKANTWITQLRTAFPTAKISAVLQCNNATASNPRFANWNSQVVANTIASVDAYTYHIYIPVGGSFQSRKAEFETVLTNTNTLAKELWITEYGNQNDITDPNYYSDLEALADYVERYPKVTIALNHLIVGNNKNKLTSDGLSFTAEGQRFLIRASRR